MNCSGFGYLTNNVLCQTAQQPGYQVTISGNIICSVSQIELDHNIANNIFNQDHDNVIDLYMIKRRVIQAAQIMQRNAQL